MTNTSLDLIQIRDSNKENHDAHRVLNRIINYFCPDSEVIVGPDEKTKHPLDETIGRRPRSGASVAITLRQSRTLAAIIRRAANEAKPLRAQGGLLYADDVRLKIADALRQSE